MILMNYNKLAFRKGREREREKGCIGANSKGPTRNHTIQSVAQFTSTNILFHFGDENGGAPGGGA